MANTVASTVPQDANEDAELQQAVRQIYAQMDVTHAQRENDQREITRLQAETRAMLSELKSFLKME